jgi:endoglucanase
MISSREAEDFLIMTSAPFLKISGNQLVDGDGAPVILRGFGLGGWLNMENLITGHPANEEAQRQALLYALGPERYAFFFECFLTAFFAEDDARFVKPLGLNLIRIPVN